MGLRQPGEVLGGRYRLIRPLGQGGMGSVWHAEHLTLTSAVALKLIETPAHPAAAVTERFLREARLAAALRSPHVVQIFDYGVDGQTPYIAMELLEGESLAARLERQGRLSAHETARVVQHVARAIGRAHDAGVIHRDLKPENVFIVRNDDEEIYKVFDFGIAKVLGQGLGGPPGAATRTGSLLGTPSYMSPEQAEGTKAVDHRTDIWALGVIAYRCLLGRLPFAEQSVGQMILAICTRPLPLPSSQGSVPEGFDAWFARACARPAEQRFADARLASGAFSALLGEEPSLPDAAPSPLPPQAALPLHSTTSQVANSEVASSRSKITSTKRVAAPIAIALALTLGGFAVSRVSASLREQRTQTAAATPDPERAALPLAPATVAPAPPPVRGEAQHPDLPAGVRLSAGVNLVPSLHRPASGDTTDPVAQDVPSGTPASSAAPRRSHMPPPTRSQRSPAKSVPSREHRPGSR
jgi:eukaryotic-like serine/threonine-protein kinase